VEVAVPAVAMVVPRAVPERGVTAVAVVAMVARAVHPVTGTAPAGLRTPVVLTQVHAIPEPARLGTGFREPALRASVSACVVPGLREVGQSQSRNGEGDDRVLDAVHCLLSSVLAKAFGFACAVRLGIRR
jgi:hypothetical protein